MRKRTLPTEQSRAHQSTRGAQTLRIDLADIVTLKQTKPKHLKTPKARSKRHHCWNISSPGSWIPSHSRKCLPIQSRSKDTGQCHNTKSRRIPSAHNFDRDERTQECKGGHATPLAKQRVGMQLDKPQRRCINHINGSQETCKSKLLSLPQAL